VSNRAYYESLQKLARSKRAFYEVDTFGFGLREVREIYKEEGIKIDIWPHLPKKIKALYMCADGDYSVAVQKTLPDEPKLFALVHELKHHYRDREALGGGFISCGDYNMNELIEKGAEVFAAEFIYPEAQFVRDIGALRISKWTPEVVIRFKRQCKARVSYRFICKRLERLEVIAEGEFDAVKFKKLEEEIYGPPLYKQLLARRSA
jgi:Zn-dependent peptidase ImmA (M78 family)